MMTAGTFMRTDNHAAHIDTQENEHTLYRGTIPFGLAEARYPNSDGTLPPPLSAAHIDTYEDCEARHARHLREVQVYAEPDEDEYGVPTTRTFPRTLQEAFPESEGYANTLHQVAKPLFRLDKPTCITLALIVLVGIAATFRTP